MSNIGDCGFDYAKYAKKINLGCGKDKRPGYLNVDLNAFHEPDLVCDVCDLNLLPSCYYENVLAMDVLEHIPRVRCLNALREWNRVLLPGGELKLQVPNLIGLLGLLSAEERQTFEEQEKIIQCLFGTQAYKGDYHFNGFTEITARQNLMDSGFKIVSIESRDEWLFNITAVKVAHVEREAFYGIKDSQDFLGEMYRQLLGREPDAEGMRFYMNQLCDGVYREEIVQSVKNSQEYLSRALGGASND